jgi:hypothetical protein
VTIDVVDESQSQSEGVQRHALHEENALNTCSTASGATRAEGERVESREQRAESQSLLLERIDDIGDIRLKHSDIGIGCR